MSSITKDLDSLYPDHNWYESELEYQQDYLRTLGINISDEEHVGRLGKRYVEPAISFSGFSSQGDGLAFDCSIDWAAFFQAEPSFAEQMTEWYLLLVANPDMVEVSTGRHSRGNTMSVEVSYIDGYADDFGAVAHGFYAGTPVDEIPMTDASLESWMKEHLEGTARDIYRGLEQMYNGECEYIREQRVEQLKEEYADEIQAALAVLPDVFTKGAAYDLLDDEDGVIVLDFDDLDALGYITYWCGTWMKKEVLCEPT